YFIEKVLSDLIGTRQKVYKISPTTPFAEKETLLRKAFAEGAIVVADEINTSLWPNKLLNNFLMGVDENNAPATQPGFMLLATQNPPSIAGRIEEDPALRQRLYKFKLDWPVISPEVKQKASTSAKTSAFSLFNSADKPATTSSPGLS